MRRFEYAVHAGRLASDVRRGVVWPHARTVRVWDSAKTDRHGAVPVNTDKIIKVLGIREGHRVLVPFSFSGEWYRTVKSAAPHTVALDISREQLRRYGGERVHAAAQALPFGDRAFDHVVAFEPTPFIGALSPFSALPTLLELLRVGKIVHVIMPTANTPRMRALALFGRVKMREQDITGLVKHNKPVYLSEKVYTYRGRPRRMFRKVTEEVAHFGKLYSEGVLRGKRLERELMRFVEQRPAARLLRLYTKESEKYRRRL